MKAVIFDMDGVVIDTEPIIDKITKEFLEEQGFILSDQLIDKYRGTKSEYFWTRYKIQLGLPENIDFYIREVRNRYLLWFRNTSTLPIVSGVIELLRDLVKHGIKTALATSGSQIRMNLIIDKLALNNLFHVKISSADVKNAKPNPEIFLKAARRLQIPCESCVVIEDSENGVNAAKEANMVVIGFKGLQHNNQDLSHADAIIDDLKKLNTKNLFKLWKKNKSATNPKN